MSMATCVLAYFLIGIVLCATGSALVLSHPTITPTRVFFGLLVVGALWPLAVAVVVSIIVETIIDLICESIL